MYLSNNGLVGRVFANDPGDLGSIPGYVIPKTLKMVLNTSLLNTRQYKVCIKGKVEQSREWSSALPYTLVSKLLKREPSGRPRLRSPTFTILILLSLLFSLTFSIKIWSLIKSNRNSPKQSPYQNLCSNLLSILLRCATRPKDWTGASNSLFRVC